MRYVTISCDCDGEEHELEVEGEAGGLFSPAIGDVLSCGRVIDEDDMEIVWEKLEERGDD